MKASEFFIASEQKSILEAIHSAEHETSGEIRVHIDDECKGDVLDCAAKVFARLNMHKTELRNGVLIYLSIKDKKFAVIGDAGINKVVPNNFWDEVKSTMLFFFKQEQFCKGIIEGVLMTSEQLKTYFPRETGDVNELSDDISFGENK